MVASLIMYNYPMWTDVVMYMDRGNVTYHWCDTKAKYASLVKVGILFLAGGWMGASPLDPIPMFAWVYDVIVMSFLLLFTSLSYFFGLSLYFYRRNFFPVNLLPVCSL